MIGEGRIRATNMWRRIRFVLDGELVLERWLVPQAHGERELSAACAVGAALLAARPGDEVEVETPGGYVVVKVLMVH